MQVQGFLVQKYREATRTMRPTRAAKTAAEVRMAVLSIDPSGVTSTHLLPRSGTEKGVGVGAAPVASAVGATVETAQCGPDAGRATHTDHGLRQHTEAKYAGGTNTTMAGKETSWRSTGGADSQRARASPTCPPENRAGSQQNGAAHDSPIPANHIVGTSNTTPLNAKIAQPNKRQKKLAHDAYLANLPRGVASWVGDTIGWQGSCHYYECFAKNGHLFRIGDCVYVKPEEKEQASYILRVISMWLDTRNNAMYFRGQWMYRPQDTKQGQSSALHAREVFLSDWEDVNPVDCVQTKCVVSWKNLAGGSEEDLEKGSHFACWRLYHVRTGTISSIADGNEAVVGRDACERRECGAIDACKYESTLDSLEEQVARGELSAHRVRKGNGPVARDLLRRAGHMFADELPCMPAQHICNLLLCAAAESIVVVREDGGVRGEVVAGATVRHHPGTQFVEIELLAVRRASQRQGYGVFVLRRLVELASSCGIRCAVCTAA